MFYVIYDICYDMLIKISYNNGDDIYLLQRWKNMDDFIYFMGYVIKSAKFGISYK